MTTERVLSFDMAGRPFQLTGLTLTSDTAHIDWRAPPGDSLIVTSDEELVIRQAIPGMSMVEVVRRKRTL